jgi:sarcosine/dimethylglycine N-methyltransferase
MRFYAEAANAVGFEVLEQIDLVHNLRSHYDFVRQELESRRRELEQHASTEYLDKMLVGLRNWVAAADNGHLAWGIQRFRKPNGG